MPKRLSCFGNSSITLPVAQRDILTSVLLFNFLSVQNFRKWFLDHFIFEEEERIFRFEQILKVGFGQNFPAYLVNVIKRFLEKI